MLPTDPVWPMQASANSLSGRTKTKVDEPSCKVRQIEEKAVIKQYLGEAVVGPEGLEPPTNRYERSALTN